MNNVGNPISEDVTVTGRLVSINTHINEIESIINAIDSVLYGGGGVNDVFKEPSCIAESLDIMLDKLCKINDTSKAIHRRLLL